MSNLNQVSPSSPRGEGGKKKGQWPFPEPDYGEGFKYDPDFNGPTRNHSCTDVICLGIFGAFLGAWGFVGYFAYTQGDINKVCMCMSRGTYYSYIQIQRRTSTQCGKVQCFITYNNIDIHTLHTIRVFR